MCKRFCSLNPGLLHIHDLDLRSKREGSHLNFLFWGSWSTKIHVSFLPLKNQLALMGSTLPQAWLCIHQLMHAHGKTIKIWLVHYPVNVYGTPRVPPTLHKCHSSFALRFNSYFMGAVTSSPHSMAPSLELCTIWFKGFWMLYRRRPPVTLIRSKWRLTDDAETDLCCTGRWDVSHFSSGESEIHTICFPENSKCDDSPSVCLPTTWTCVSVCDITHQNPLWTFPQHTGVHACNMTVNYSERAPSETLYIRRR